MQYLFALFALLCFTQCAPKSDVVAESNSTITEQTTDTQSGSTRLRMGRPTEKDVMWIIMKNHDYPLSVSETCEGVGTSFEDQTMGDYLAGFWQYHSCTSCNNSLDIIIEEGNQAGADSKHWDIRFMINGQTESESWSWGAAFAVGDEGWEIMRSSFRCLGAG